MARIFVTGSAGGLGQLAARSSLEDGHEVVLHARNPRRAEDTRKRLPAAKAVVVGDLASLAQTRGVAEQANRLGPFDAVIHNAGVGYREPRVQTEDGLPRVFQVNVLSFYALTALIERPKRLVYLSSGMHRGADASLDDLGWTKRRWRGAAAYAETKLCDVLLAFAVARRWPSVFSNAVDPGWVPTRMGGPTAPDDLEDGYRTQVWLAVSDDPVALVSGKYFHHLRPKEPDPATHDVGRQEKLLEICARLSGLALDSGVRS
jgi:NAD(P)-dependent dehydrogenase (short-subunit alcohol dehydrogenase family)